LDATGLQTRPPAGIGRPRPWLRIGFTLFTQYEDYGRRS
jgi:hypothetical protein